MTRNRTVHLLSGFGVVLLLLSHPQGAEAEEWSHAPLFGLTHHAVSGFPILPDDFVGIEADKGVVQTTESITHSLAPYAKFHLRFVDSTDQKFGGDRLSRTHESNMEMTLETEDTYENTWTSQFRSVLTRQAIDEYWQAHTVDSDEYRTYTFSHAWKRQFGKSSWFELLAGVAQCQDRDEKRSRIYPYGGVQWLKRFDWGEVVGSILQVVRGGGALTGIYGSQLERRFGLNSKVELVKGLTFLLDCSLAVAPGVFREDGILQKAPIVTAGAKVAYQLTEHLSGSVGYAHRQLLGGSNLLHGAEGPMAVASLSYTIF